METSRRTEEEYLEKNLQILHMVKMNVITFFYTVDKTLCFDRIRLKTFLFYRLTFIFWSIVLINQPSHKISLENELLF